MLHRTSTVHLPIYVTFTIQFEKNVGRCSSPMGHLGTATAISSIKRSHHFVAKEDVGRGVFQKEPEIQCSPCGTIKFPKYHPHRLSIL